MWRKKHQVASPAPLVLLVPNGAPRATVHLPHCTKAPPEARHLCRCSCLGGLPAQVLALTQGCVHHEGTLSHKGAAHSSGQPWASHKGDTQYVWLE